MEATLTRDTTAFTLPGISHHTLAGRGQHLAALELWRQTLAPGATTPVHSHACEEVVVVLAGTGVVVEGERRLRFRAGDTVVIAPGSVHQIVNDGDAPIDCVAAFSETPARAFAVDGTRVALPWEAGADAHVSERSA